MCSGTYVCQSNPRTMVCKQSQRIDQGILQLFWPKSKQIFNFVNNLTFKKGTNVHFGWQIAIEFSDSSIISFQKYFFHLRKISLSCMYRRKRGIILFFFVFFFFSSLNWFGFSSLFSSVEILKWSAGRKFFRMENALIYLWCFPQLLHKVLNTIYVYFNTKRFQAQF